jgi:hypothetical protein
VPVRGPDLPVVSASTAIVSWIKLHHHTKYRDLPPIRKALIRQRLVRLAANLPERDRALFRGPLAAAVCEYLEEDH